MNELVGFMSQHGLSRGRVHDHPALKDAAVQSGLQRHVDLVGGVCRAFTRAEGLNLTRLVSPEAYAAPPGGYSLAQISKFREAVLGLDLTEQQVKGMAYVREVFRRRLGGILQARSGLNAEALGLMAAAGTVATDADGQPLGFGSLMVRSRQSCMLQTLMDRLKENLREEQRMASELQYIICRKLLQPLQIARLIQATFPHHCDPMALLDVSHSLFVDREGEADDQASSPPLLLLQSPVCFCVRSRESIAEAYHLISCRRPPLNNSPIGMRARVKHIAPP